MSLKVGIVGLPNAGKSTLFNALVKNQSAPAENFPFCTVEPNVGIVEVPDERLDKISEIANSKKKIAATVEFFDIAGLVRGASKGEGLGNKFLGNIRECAAIAMVLRFFDDENVSHVEGGVDPKRDREVLETELILSDLETVEKRIAKHKKNVKTGDKKIIKELDILERLYKSLENGKVARLFPETEEEREFVSSLFLLSEKKIIFVANVTEGEISDFSAEQGKERIGVDNQETLIPVSAKIEAELTELSDEEKKEFLSDFNLEKSSLENLIKAAYDILGLETFFTAGEKESRAWTVKKNSLAPKAAGVIHTDFEKGFIRAEVISYDDFISCNGESGAREKGLLRIEGKDYTVKDGDIMHFRFNV